MKKIILLFSFIFLSCVSETYSDLLETNDPSLFLKWNKAYENDDIHTSVIGLKWALSYIGAKLPANANGITASGNRIAIDLNKLGFSENAKNKLHQLHETLKNTSEYQLTGTIDLGRYVSLLLGSSEHYYKIAGVPENLNTLLNKYTLKPEKGYVNDSGVSLEHRIIRFSEQNGLNQLFVSSEINPADGTVLEYETIELLENGQLRFGIFDPNGQRKNNADPVHSNAGKPAKCMWCHESSIQPLFSIQNNYNGYLSYNDFQNTLLNYRVSHNAIKNSLSGEIDFSQTQQHTLTELLYISFMEPSAERLSLEWNLPLAEVQSRLSGLTTHVYPEFPFLGNLYNRNDVEALAPFQGLAVSDHVREQSPNEVNYIN